VFGEVAVIIDPFLIIEVFLIAKGMGMLVKLDKTEGRMVTVASTHPVGNWLALTARVLACDRAVGPFRDIGELELLAVVHLLGVLVKVPGQKILHDGHVLVPEDDGERDDELGHVVETAERPVAE